MSKKLLGFIVVLSALSLIALGCGGGDGDSKNGKNGKNGDGKTGNGKTENGKTGNGKTENGKTGNGKTGNGEFKFSEWDAWDSVGDGSMVELASVSVFSGNKSEMTMATTRISKEGDVINVETVMTMKGGKPMAPQKRQIKKTSKVYECPKCKKAHKTESKTAGKEDVEVDGKKISCTVIEGKGFDCDGKETSSSKGWYSKSVPGWMVKMESKMSAGTSNMTVTKFEKK